MQIGTPNAPSRTRLIDAFDVYHLLVIALILITRWCDAPRLRRSLVRVIGGAAHRWSQKRATMERALESALALDRQADRAAIVRQTFMHRWEEIFSYAPCTEDIRAFQRARVEGAEHLRAALAEGHGALLWTSALGKGLAARAVLHGHGFAICQVHGTDHLGEFSTSDGLTRVRSAIIKRFLDAREKRWLSELVYLPAAGSLAFARQLRQRLERNTIVCMTGDFYSGQRLMPVRILGHTQFFPAGLVGLAQLCRAPILPMYCVTENDGRLRVVVEAPIRVSSDADREHGYQRILDQLAQLLESYIRRYPGQYRHWHRLGTGSVLATTVAATERRGA
ncbi:MAG: lysophospholipid acyltransferase family protein [Burkholderiales bacterium]